MHCIGVSHRLFTLIILQRVNPAKTQRQIVFTVTEMCRQCYYIATKLQQHHAQLISSGRAVFTFTTETSSRTAGKFCKDQTNRNCEGNNALTLSVSPTLVISHGTVAKVALVNWTGIFGILKRSHLKNGQIYQWESSLWIFFFFTLVIQWLISLPKYISYI